MKLTLALSAVAAAMMTSGTATVANAAPNPEKKVSICHVEEDGTRVDLYIGVKAAQAHLAKHPYDTSYSCYPVC